MQNPKTTVPGLLLIAAAAFVLLGHALPLIFAGNMSGALAQALSDWPAVAAALAGFAAVGAKDGGA